MDVSVYAASVDALEHARDVAGHCLSFPVAYGATEEHGEEVGAWWSEERGGFIQPAEFLLDRGGVVLGSIYASGPVGRMRAEEVIRLIKYREGQRKEQEQKAG